MFKLLGIALLVYTAYSAMTGVVHAKSGIGMRTVRRTSSPGYFWTVLGIYTLLAFALLTIF